MKTFHWFSILIVLVCLGWSNRASGAQAIDHVALGKATSQSSNYSRGYGDSSHAVDSYTSGNWGDRSVTATYTSNSGAAIITASGENSPRETKEKAFDGNTATKWLTFADSGWIQYQFAGSTAKVIKSYSITSANDFPERDPRDWSLRGSNDGSTWTTLDTRSGVTFTSRFQKQTFNFSNTTAYKMYRLDIASNYNPPVANSTQLSELELSEGSNPTTYALTVTSGSGSGSYAAGENVPITANTAPSGQVFDKWVPNSGNPTIASVTSANTTLTMPTNSAAVTATYRANSTGTYNEVENNDSISAANAVPDTATKIVATISSSTDKDYFKVNVGASVTLTVDMTGPAVDYDLYLYNSSGTELTSSTGNTAKEALSYKNTGTSAVSYYIYVEGYNGATSSTSYNLALTKSGTPSSVSVTINPTTANISVNTTKQFEATVSGTTNNAVTWTCTGGGTVNNGLYTAPSAACTATVKATSVADSTKFASATVTVTSNYFLTTTVTPPGSGTLERNPNATSYAPGKVVTLTATPANNYTFSGWSGNAMGTSSTIKIRMNGNKSVIASFRGSDGNCGTPPFNPEPWNDEGTVQENNNCYNYSNNVRTDTFAQPGDYCGQELNDITCAEVIAAAKCDGLVQTTKDAVLPPGMTRIALVVGNGFDFHWYRQDSNGMWSHKPGDGRARNTDESGQLISDPEACDRGDYTSFCLYFQICSGVEQFGGHSTIK